MILLIDNYDSFSYNLFQLASEVYENIKVVRNDEISIDEIANLSPEAIIISPGPGKPEEAGICIDVIKNFFDKIPILGVCLGHQAITVAFGGVVGYASELMHGKKKPMNKVGESVIFEGIEPVFYAARYHSLAADKKYFPECLQITAISDEGEIMACQHKDYPVFGLQFHPESVMTPDGIKMMKNFVNSFKK